MTTRPPLPLQHRNQHIKAILQASVLPQVKYQILSCQGQDILVGRLKIETPTSAGHAFILRRYDTGAVSLTTMFRAAFPSAPDADEKMELQWVKDNHNLAGNNGSSREPHITRLAGTWVSPTLALELGKAYELGVLIQQVVDAIPDPNANYRRSGKGQKDQDTPRQPSKTATNLPTPSPTTTVAAPTPAKRRKEGSPTPAAPAPPSSPNNKPAPRRSTRTKSPPPKTKPPSSIMNAVASAATTSTTTKPKSSRSTKRSESMVEPPAIDQQEAHAIAEAAAQELYEQDMAEQKEMIKTLSSTRSPAEKPKSGKGKAASKASKRVREEEEKLQFDFKEPEQGDRTIATNKRVGLLQEPRRKSAAWGLGLFVFGAGAITLLPNFF